MAATRDESNAKGEALGAARNSLQPDRFRNARKNDSPAGAIHDLRIGPAGWAYKDWNGVVYPSPRPRGFHEAEYLAQFFDTIEINTSFYSPLDPAHCRQWLARIAANPRFLFTAKLWQRFTHEGSLAAADVAEARLGFDVLHQAARLGA